MKTHRHTFDPRLYLVLDPAQTRGREVLSVAEQAVKNGATMVQLRWKDGGAREFATLARRLVDMLEIHGIPLIVNDRIDIAWASGAHGAHVGQGDLDLSDARAMLGRRAILGLSVTNADEARNVPNVELDYIGLGPVFATNTKVDAAPPLGLDGFVEARALLRLPVVAIGGITAGNAASVFAAGANGIAVSSAICAADDPGEATRKLEEVMLASGAAAVTRSGAAGFDQP